MFGTTAPTDFNDNAPRKQVIPCLLSRQILTIITCMAHTSLHTATLPALSSFTGGDDDVHMLCYEKFAVAFIDNSY
jgi:hypothetical protein